MNSETLGYLQDEYRASRDGKVERYHTVWRPILDEFGLRNFGDVWRHVTRYKEADKDTPLSGQGRIGSLNVLVRKMASLVSLRDPEFTVRSENPWDDAVSAVLEHAFEANRRAIGWNRQMKKVVLEGMLFGTGFAKVGYGSEFMYDESAWSGRIPSKAKHLLSPADAALPYGLTTEYSNFNVQEGMPMMVHVPTADIFYNLGVKAESDIRRVYHRTRRPLADVLRDSRYSDAAKSEVCLSRWGDTNGSWLFLETYDQNVTFVETIECFDLVSRQYCVFTEHATKALRTWTPFPFPIENPHHRFVPIPHPTDVWGIPYALLILGQAQAMNRLRGVIIEAISRDGKKIYLGNADHFDVEERRKVENSKDGQFLWIKGFDPEKGAPFHPVEFGGARPEVLELVRFIERDQAWVSGLTDAALNDSWVSDETATAVAQRAEQQGLTVDEFVQENEMFQEEVAVDLMKIKMSRWDSKKLVQVIGPDPNVYFWTPVNLERMLGTFTLQVIAGSTQKRDKPTQRKQWIEMIPLLFGLDDRIKMDLQIQQATTTPEQPGQAGFVNWHEVIRLTLELFDPTIARKVLRPDNVVMLVQRLMEQYTENPLYMSPDLERQVKMMASQPVMPGMSGPGAGGQEGLAGLGMDFGGVQAASQAPGQAPSPQNVNSSTMGLYSETPGMVGRMN
jgi:hypothetical protein